MAKEEKPAGQAIFANQFCFNLSKKKKPAHPPLAQGLDPPLKPASKMNPEYWQKLFWLTFDINSSIFLSF